MSRPALLVTGLFYALFGFVIAITPTHYLTITRSTFEAFAHSQVTQGVIGSILLLAGVLTLCSTLWYSLRPLRIVAAALRSGSMFSVLSLVILTYLFLPSGSLTAVIIFGYLFIISLLTLPPPIEPINAALAALDENRKRTEGSTGARLDSLEATRRANEAQTGE